MGQRTFNGEVRAILKDAAKEMGFAVDSIRKEVIEKGWFEQSDLTPEVADRWAREDTDAAQLGNTGPQDFRHDATRADLYGRDPETERGQDREEDRSPER